MDPLWFIKSLVAHRFELVLLVALSVSELSS
jgi:hypothetical protein